MEINATTRQIIAPTSVRSRVKPSMFHSFTVLSLETVANFCMSGLRRHLVTYAGGVHTVLSAICQTYSSTTPALCKYCISTGSALLQPKVSTASALSQHCVSQTTSGAQVVSRMFRYTECMSSTSLAPFAYATDKGKHTL